MIYATKPWCPTIRSPWQTSLWELGIFPEFFFQLSYFFFLCSSEKELHELMDELFEICEPENASFEGEEYQDGSKIQDNFNIPPK